VGGGDGKGAAPLRGARKEGWVAFTPDGRYKPGGNPAGSFWFLSGLCRFEPGELDPYVPSIRRLASDEPLFGVR